MHGHTQSRWRCDRCVLTIARDKFATIEHIPDDGLTLQAKGRIARQCKKSIGVGDRAGQFRRARLGGSSLIERLTATSALASPKIRVTSYVAPQCYIARPDPALPGPLCSCAETWQSTSADTSMDHDGCATGRPVDKCLREARPDQGDEVEGRDDVIARRVPGVACRDRRASSMTRSLQ